MELVTGFLSPVPGYLPELYFKDEKMIGSRNWVSIRRDFQGRSEGVSHCGRIQRSRFVL